MRRRSLKRVEYKSEKTTLSPEEFPVFPLLSEQHEVRRVEVMAKGAMQLENGEVMEFMELRVFAAPSSKDIDRRHKGAGVGDKPERDVGSLRRLPPVSRRNSHAN